MAYFLSKQLTHIIDQNVGSFMANRFYCIEDG